MSESILHICDDSTLHIIREKAIKALKKGHEVKWFDGTRQWVNWEIFVDLGKNDSDMYIWDKSFNRVLHEVYLYTDKDGEVTKRKINEVYRGFDILTY
jgi:hypothetical protein